MGQSMDPKWICWPRSSQVTKRLPSGCQCSHKQFMNSVKFRDALNLWYERTPRGLQPSCVGCNPKFSVRPAIECKKAVFLSHVTMRFKTNWLASLPRPIPHLHFMKNPKFKAVATQKCNRMNETRRTQWNASFVTTTMKTVVTFWFVDYELAVRTALSMLGFHTSMPSHISPKTHTKSYQPVNTRRRRNTLGPASGSIGSHFALFLVSTDGILGKEAKILLKKQILLKKLYINSKVCGFGNASMSIVIVRATHLCLRGSRIPTSKMCNRLPQWEDNAGPGLFQH